MATLRGEEPSKNIKAIEVWNYFHESATPASDLGTSIFDDDLPFCQGVGFYH